MRKSTWISALVAAVMAATAPQAQAESAVVEVTVAYRERIALPPDAQLEVELLDVSRADAKSTRIALQRFSMKGVPMTVGLTYDPLLAPDGARLALGSAIWSGDRKVFALTFPQMLSAPPDAGPVEVMLAMIPEAAPEAGPALPIQGIAWRVTEVLGEPWEGDNRATLAIDDTMQFSIFGGCNRFVGQVTTSGNEISFPPAFAGTLMACPEPAEAKERVFLDALRRVARHVRYGAGMVLTDAHGNALMHFEQAPS